MMEKMSYKLKKRNVLRKNKQFQEMYRSGRSYANRLAVLYVMVSQPNVRRMGFAAGKRLGGAVVRNRVKRLLREVYRLQQDQLITGHDFILVGRQGILSADYRQITSAVQDLFRRAKIIVRLAGKG
jgi:ribonuclease P protein component